MHTVIEPFVKYDEIRGLPSGTVLEVTDSITACHPPDENGWRKLDVNAGVLLRVASVHDDCLTAIIPLGIGFHIVTIFSTQWNRLEPVGWLEPAGKTSDAGNAQ